MFSPFFKNKNVPRISEIQCLLLVTTFAAKRENITKRCNHAPSTMYVQHSDDGQEERNTVSDYQEKYCNKTCLEKKMTGQKKKKETKQSQAQRRSFQKLIFLFTWAPPVVSSCARTDFLLWRSASFSLRPVPSGLQSLPPTKNLQQTKKMKKKSWHKDRSVTCQLDKGFGGVKSCTPEYRIHFTLYKHSIWSY